MAQQKAEVPWGAGQTPYPAHIYYLHQPGHDARRVGIQGVTMPICMDRGMVLHPEIGVQLAWLNIVT